MKLTIQQKLQKGAIARRVLNSLSNRDRGYMLDDMVLGCFDPASWDVEPDNAVEIQLYKMLAEWEESQ